MSDVTSWREEFHSAREGDESPIVAVAPDESVLDVMFDGGWGGINGPNILIWTEQRVYFPVQYDGSEYLGSAPRNPVPEGQAHEGGG